jgi:hypothetical protein
MTRSSTFWFDRKVPDWAQELIDERGLAVINVRDDGDVADFLHELAAGPRR